MSLNHFTYSEIDLSKLENNINVIRSLIGGSVRLTCVIKDNAYGHGAVAVGRALESFKVDFLAVNSLPEALEINESGIKLPILIMGAIADDEINDILLGNFHVVLFDFEFAKKLNSFCEKTQKRINCHIKVDTGMNRVGISRHMLEEFLNFARKLKNLNLCGIMSHLPDYNTNEAVKEIDDFGKIIRSRWSGLKFVHLASSGSTFYHKDAHFDMVRCGLSIYGYLPKRDLKSEMLKPVMSLKTRVLAIKNVLKNETISYNRSYRARRDMRVAVLPIGYADGYFKSYSKFGEVIINGKRVKIVGDICMDMMMADVTDLPSAKPFDDVILMGESGNESISAYDISEKTDFIPYEILTSIKREIPKKYINYAISSQQI